MENIIKVNGELFRKCVKSALTATVKKAAVPMCEQVLVKASSGKLYICANSIEQAVRYSMDCNDFGGFEITLHNETIKKLLNVKGDTLSIGTVTDNVMRVESGKKTMELSCITPSKDDFDYESFTTELSHDRTHIFTIDCNELASGINAISPFTADNQSKPILCGYGFKNGTISAVDGFTACRKAWKNYVQINEYEFTASHKLENFKSIFTKNTNQVNAFSTKYGTVFTAYDGEIMIDYYVRNIQGEFCNVNQFFPNGCKAEISVKAGDILDIAKEYKSYVNAKERYPMVLVSKENDLFLNIRTNDMRVSQSFNSDYNGNIYIHTGYNVDYTMRCFNLYGKSETVKMRYSGDYSPLYISNGEYECLLLPVRLKPETDAA